MRTIATLGLLILFISCEDKKLDELSISSEAEQKLTNQSSVSFVTYEESAHFPGGNLAILEFIKENIKVPPVCAEGRVFVTFTVEKDGFISDVEVVKGLSKEHDTEAIRLVKSFPRWEPGKQYGIPVRTKMMIPIGFKTQANRALGSVFLFSNRGIIASCLPLYETKT